MSCEAASACEDVSDFEDVSDCGATSDCAATSDCEAASACEAALSLVAASSHKYTSYWESASVNFGLTLLGSNHRGASLLAKWFRRHACGACDYFHVCHPTLY